MKQLIIICVLALGANAAFAQTTDRSSYTPTRTVKQTRTVTKDTRFEGTEMAYQDGTISFSNLPALTKDPWAVITDENGELIKQGRITADNAIDVHKLQKGMYFVSLVYRNRTEKGFVLAIE